MPVALTLASTGSASAAGGGTALTLPCHGDLAAALAAARARPSR